MTVVLDTDSPTLRDARPAQTTLVLGLNLLCVTGVALGAHAAGMGWAASLLVGTLGCVAATLTGLVILVVLLPVASGRLPEEGREQTPAEIDRQWTIDLWEGDALLDSLQTRAALQEANQPSAA